MVLTVAGPQPRNLRIYSLHSEKFNLDEVSGLEAELTPLLSMAGRIKKPRSFAALSLFYCLPALIPLAD